MQKQLNYFWYFYRTLGMQKKVENDMES